MAKTMCSLRASSTGGLSSARSGLRPAANGHGQGRTPSQSPEWHTGSWTTFIISKAKANYFVADPSPTLPTLG